MEDGTIAEMVERARSGDESALERLYHLHSRRVYGLCLKMTSNRAEAEDLTQEVFLQAFRKLSTFQGDAAFSTWLYRIGTNVVLMRHRKKVHPEVSLKEITKPGGAVVAAFDPMPWTDPADCLVVRLSVRQALDQLREGYKRLVVLHDMQGYSHGEIAEMTGRTVGNSKSPLRKVRQRLRELLGTARAAC